MSKEYKIPKETFIGGWFIEPKICDEIIEYFKSTPDSFKKSGEAYELSKSVVNKKVKDSTDINITHTFLISPFDKYRKQLQECLEQYFKKYPDAERFPRFNINSSYNIQYYKPGGGFKEWHAERVSATSMNRVLVFMTFLNDVPDGGTMFKHQKITVPAKKGLTLFWPTDWTHTHKGQVSKKHEKYIATGWYTINDF